MDEPTLQRHRESVAAAARRLAAEGLVRGTSGNVSERAGDLIAVTPTGAQLAELGPADITFVSLDGEVVHGSLKPTSELWMHLGVYERYAPGAIVHTHAPNATAVACSLDELPCVHYEMLLLGGAVPVAPFHPFGSRELADAVADALSGRSATLLANHGTLVHADDAATAVERTLLLEWMSRLYVTSASLGSPKVLTEAQQEAVVTAAIQMGYGRTHTID